MKASKSYIKILDPVYSEASKDLVGLLRENFNYTYEIWNKQWVDKGNGKKVLRKVKKPGYMISVKGLFLSGLIPSVTKLLDREGIDYDMSINEDFIPPIPGIPKVKGVEFRDYQVRLIKSASVHGRGVIKASTGSGKSLTALGIISCYPDSKILFLCHNLSIITQTAYVFKKHGFDVSVAGGGNRDLSGQIVIGTIQTMSTFKTDQVFDMFDIIFVDEVHRVNDLKSQYGKFLQNNLAPMRFGLTATLPEGKQKLLALEGLIGPVIDTFSVSEGVDQGYLAKPQIRLMALDEQSSLSDLARYADIYEEGIVKNKHRNGKIVKITNSYNRKGMSVLIMIKDIAHGKLLHKNLPSALFVRGMTDKEDREKVRIALDKKEIMTVITTTVFREGVDIPSLDVVVNACGGKGEIMTLQAIGRGLRSTKDKSEVIVVDFLDIGKFLSIHAIKRISLYIEQGWM